MNEPKRHHLVPGFYLRRFAQDERVELVQRADLRRSVLVNVDDALVQKHFYSIETEDGRNAIAEKLLATNIEGPAARAIARVVNQRKPLRSPGLRNAISAFLAFQVVRGEAYRHAQVELFKALAERVASLQTPEMVRRELERQGEPVTQEEANGIVAFAQRGEYTIGVDSESNLHLESAFKVVLDLIPCFDTRKWVLLEFEFPALITGDEPVALVGQSLSPGEVLGLERAPEIVFPTDPRHALVMVRKDLLKADRRSRGTPQMAAVINRHVAFGCHRFIVRHPGTDPLRGLAIPPKGDPVVTCGDYVILLPRVSAEARAEWIKRSSKRLR